MGTYKRLPRGKEKSGDDFISWTTHAFLWVGQNWKTTLELVAAGLVVLALVVGAGSYGRHRCEVASAMLYSAGRLPQGSDEQVRALEQIARDYSRTPSGSQAMMRLGNISLDQKKYDEAIEHYTQLAARSRNKPLLGIAAAHMIAGALFAKGDFQAAGEQYLKAAADPHNVISAVSRFRAARCFEQSGNVDRAAQVYRQIISEAPDKNGESKAQAEKSEERLLWLLAERRIKG